MDDLTEEFGIEFDSEDIDTIGGWLQSRNTNLQRWLRGYDLWSLGCFRNGIPNYLGDIKLWI